MRILLIAAGLVGAGLLPFIAADVARAAAGPALIDGGPSVLAVVVHCAYGALAGWAVGGLIAHLFGER